MRGKIQGLILDLRGLILGMSGLILGPRANFGSKRVDFRPGRANSAMQKRGDVKDT